MMCGIVGPKLYIASRDHDKQGSTRLHKDMTGAVNVMAHALPGPTPNDKGAEWVIFLATDAETLSAFLRQREGLEADSADPVHSQRCLFDSDMLRELWRQCRVAPFKFVQKPGQAVFIPPGAAHQVRHNGR